jgi:hypothetical protein
MHVCIACVHTMHICYKHDSSYDTATSLLGTPLVTHATNSTALYTLLVHSREQVRELALAPLLAKAIY